MSLLHSLYRGGWLRTIDVSFANSLQRARGETPDLLMAAAALASRALANGHSQLPLSLVGDLLQEIVADRDPPMLPPLDEWLTLLRASPWVATPPDEVDAGVLVLEQDALSLRRYWNYEMRLARAIASRLATPAHASAGEAPSARIAQLFAAGDGRIDPTQVEAARASLSNNFLLLTGGPGTGKTTTVARTLVLFVEYFSRTHAGAVPRIVLAAPTGKAAARLAEAVRENLAQLLADGLITTEFARLLPGEASTLHRLLGWQHGTVEFRHNARHPLPADLVIVDEASMIDLPLMCKLLEAVPASATLLLIGDRDQLPSVETGDVLAALCAAGDTGRVHLTRSHRQASDVDVTELANLVRDGDVGAAIDGLAQQRFRGVDWRQGSDRALAEAVLAQALPAYRALQSAADVPAALAAARRFRVLTAVREGAAGSQTLNALIASALDPARRGDGFFPGRLVLINENSYRHQLFNGDIGVVRADEFGELRVWFDADGGPRAWLPAALPAHESAFALTVHKSQGSEFEQVFFALPEHGARVVSRELIYTGLTRCRQSVTLWANETTLGEGIARKAQRWSGLAKRL
jgi:exodeoxyribonuclease V alpha subunit